VGVNNWLLRSMGLSVLAVAGILLLSPFLPRKEFERGMRRREAK
jgi:hypothetical protein